VSSALDDDIEVDGTGQVRLVVVVIPVRDEVDRVAACLDALSMAIAELATSVGPLAVGPRVRTVVVLDRCTDGTAQVVAGYPWVETVTSDAGRVGAARALGVQAALDTEVVPPQSIWVATTDADSRVPPAWLRHQLDLATEGVDLFRGLVEPDPAECGSAAYDAWSSAYIRADGHAHVHGANLGVRADAYQLCGGFDELAALDEDVALMRTAQLRSLRVVASAQAPVATSGRLRSRVEGDGFAGYLRRLTDAPTGEDSESASRWTGPPLGGSTRSRGSVMGTDDKLSNKIDELKGRAKELEGKATDDEAREAQGKGEQSTADLKQAGEKVKDAFKN
jgi:uncharacterized protein YjbJ (UPF0337 family)